MLFLVSDATGRPEVYRLDLRDGARGVGRERSHGHQRHHAAESGALGVAQHGPGRRDHLPRLGYEISFLEPNQLGTEVAAATTPSLELRSASADGAARRARSPRRSPRPRTGFPPRSDFPTTGYKPKMSLLSIGQSVGMSTSGVVRHVLRRRHLDVVQRPAGRPHRLGQRERQRRRRGHRRPDRVLQPEVTLELGRLRRSHAAC